MAGKSIDLLLKITASTKGAVSELDKVAGALKGAENQGTKAGGLISGAFDKTKAALEALPPVAKAVGGAAAVAGAAMAAFALSGVEKFAALTAEVRKVKGATGATAEEASLLTNQLKVTGVGVDAGSAAFGRLAAKLGSGKLDLAEYGVQVAHTRDGHVDLVKTIGNVADAYSHSNSATERARLGQAAFGKGYQALAPLLSKTRTELESLNKAAKDAGLIFHDSDLDKGREFNRTMEELNGAVEGVQVSVGRLLIPALTALAGTLTNVINVGRQFAETVGPAVFDQVTAGAKGLLETLPGIGPAIQIGTTALDYFGGSSDAGAEASTRLAAATRAAAAEADSEAEALKNAQTALENKNNAAIASLSSELQAKQSAIDLAKAVSDGLSPLDLASAALAAGGAQAKVYGDAYQLSTGQTATAAQQNDFLRASLINIRNQYPQLHAVLDGWIARLGQTPKDATTNFHANVDGAISNVQRLLNKIYEAKGTYSDAVRAGLVLGPAVPGRAVGGPVSAGSPYVVGEHGPELFVPGQSGMVIPNGRTVSGGVGGITINVSAGSAHPAQVGQAVIDSIKAYERGNGNAWRN